MSTEFSPKDIKAQLKGMYSDKERFEECFASATRRVIALSERSNSLIKLPILQSRWTNFLNFDTYYYPELPGRGIGLESRQPVEIPLNQCTTRLLLGDYREQLFGDPINTHTGITLEQYLQGVSSLSNPEDMLEIPRQVTWRYHSQDEAKNPLLLRANLAEPRFKDRWNFFRHWVPGADHHIGPLFKLSFAISADPKPLTNDDIQYIRRSRGI